MPNNKNTLGALIATAAIMGLSLPASATLIGDTITIESTANIPIDNWADSVLVGGGVELVGGGANNHSGPGSVGGFAHLFTGDSYDIGASSITIVYGAIGGSGFPYAFQSIFSDFQVTDGSGNVLVGATLAAGSTGLIGSNISAIGDEGFTFQGTVDLVIGANFTLDLIFGAPPPPTEVPEPATLPLLMAGLLGLIAWRRRRLA